MRRRTHRIATLLALALAGCSGGSSPIPQQQSHSVTPSGHATQVVTFVLHVPPAPAPPPGPHRNFIAPTTQGILAAAYVHPYKPGTAPAGSVAVDLSSKSVQCSSNPNGGRICSFAIPAPPGLDDFVLTSYDAPPNAQGSFGSAKVLATATVSNVTIATGKANTVNVALGGVIAKLAFAPAQQEINGATAVMLPLALTAYDADGNIIVAGANTVSNGPGNTQSDTYANPITVSLTESGGTGQTTLLVDNVGVPAGGKATILRSSDTLSVAYSGGAPVGYSATVNASTTGPSSSATSVIDPFIIAPHDIWTVATGGSYSVSNGIAGAAFSVTPTGCTGVTFSPVSGGVIETGTISNTSDVTCSFTVSDGSQSATIPFTSNKTPMIAAENAVVELFFATPGTTAAPVSFVALHAFANATGAAFANGAFAVTDRTGNAIYVYPMGAVDGTPPLATITGPATRLAGPAGITYDPVTNRFWVANYGDNSLVAFAASANGNVAPLVRIAGSATRLASPNDVAVDNGQLAGEIFVTNNTDHGKVLAFAPTASGNVAPVTVFTDVHFLRAPTSLQVILGDPRGDRIAVTSPPYGAIASFDAAGPGFKDVQLMTIPSTALAGVLQPGYGAFASTTVGTLVNIKSNAFGQTNSRAVDLQAKYP